MIPRIFFSTLLSLIIFSQSCPQKVSAFEIDISEINEKMNIPVSINLNDNDSFSDSLLRLIQISNNEKTEIPFQINNNKLSFMVNQENEKENIISYEIVKGKPKKFEKIFSEKEDGALIIRTKKNNFLIYFFETLYPPKGIDTAYKRSGFIHPLWSPNGQVLTRIQPPDHYHHYGIWNPWTHVLFEGDTIDFWNIGDRKGTVRFAKFLSLTEGSVYSGYEALHEHVVFKKNGEEKIAINEIQSIKVYKPEDDQDYYLVDIDIEMECATESPVLLLEYRYGGLGWRTTEKWNKDNSEVLTSEGKTRKDADGSTARWCIVQGEIDDDYAGVVMMSHPENYNHPEPLRIWPENQYDRGDMFANFSPTKNKDWLLEPDKKYHLKYRFMVFNNRISKEIAETAWQSFANHVSIKITKP